MLSKQKAIDNDQEDMRKILDQKDSRIRELEEQIRILKEKEAKIKADGHMERRETSEEDSIHLIKKSVHLFQSKHNRRNETKKFVDQYLKDHRYTKEQIEFLLSCMEEGVRIRDIEKFAIPGVSVEVMKRLKALS